MNVWAKLFIFQESKCLLTIYMVFLIVAVGAVIAGAVLGYDQDANVIQKGLNQTLAKYTLDADTNTERSWDAMNKDVRRNNFIL